MKISKTAAIATVVFLAVSAFCIVGKTSSPKIQYKDGTYNVTVQGRNAPIELEMVVSKGKPSAVNVLSQEESFFAQPAEEEIIKAFIGGKKIGQRRDCNIKRDEGRSSGFAESGSVADLSQCQKIENIFT